MLSRHLACLALLSSTLCSAQYGAFAQDADAKPNVPLQKTIGVVTPTGPVPSLFVVNSTGAKLEGDKLIMTGVAMNSIVFADRPVRAAGHVTTEQFIQQWDEGADNFIKDPPNATISVLEGDGSKVEDAVITLRSPKLEAGDLTFQVSVLEGRLGGASGPAALFIDRGGGGGGRGGFGGGGFGGGDFGGGGFARGGDFGGGGFDRAADFRGFSGSLDRAGGEVRFGDGRYGYRPAEGDAFRYNYWHAPVYHGAWYAGAPAVGLGALAWDGWRSNYYGSGQCGYYPYPPCY
ncbi:MAG TPA: hypothetical protein VNS34_28300 [Rhizobiaceae bacterium]|nr:hypothetical protein [Rhizobiaceae bacterium]